MRRYVVIVAIALVALLSVAPVGAITYGEPDNGRHPNVGALIVDEDGSLNLWCSGTLISPTVFLTAAHCYPGEGVQVYVTFDEQYTAKSKLISGTMIPYEGYPGPASDPGDIAVVLLDRAVRGITPASIPPYVGYFDELAAQGGLNGQTFTAVGYGSLEPSKGPGGHQFAYPDARWTAVSSFSALNDAWLRLSQNPSTGNAGTCYGDSGGPNFLGDSTMIASITVTGDAFCRSTNVTYRLDSPVAQEFLSRYL